MLPPTPNKPGMGDLGHFPAEIRLNVYKYCSMNSRIAVRHAAIDNYYGVDPRLSAKVIRISPLAGTSRALFGEINNEAAVGKVEHHEVMMWADFVPNIDYVPPPSPGSFNNATTLTVNFKIEAVDQDRLLDLHGVTRDERHDSAVRFFFDFLKFFPELNTAILKLQGRDYQEKHAANDYYWETRYYAAGFEYEMGTKIQDLVSTGTTGKAQMQHVILLVEDTPQVVSLCSEAMKAEPESARKANRGTKKLGFGRHDISKADSETVEELYNTLRQTMETEEAAYWTEVFEMQVLEKTS